MDNYQIIFRGFPPSKFISDAVEDRVVKLTQFYKNIKNCKVVLSVLHRHHHSPKIYHVQVSLHIPRADLVVSHDREKDQSHEDVYVSIRDAFDAVERRLEEFVRRRRKNTRRKDMELINSAS